MLKKKNTIGFIHSFILYGLILIFLSSCVSQRDLEYLRQKKSESNVYSIKNLEEYKLKPGDELYIKISSLDDVTSSLSSPMNNSTNSIGGVTPYGASLVSYSVDKEGYLELAVIGKLQVKDKTLSQVESAIKTALVKVLNEPMVSVKLVNAYISILGEVRTPGHYVFAENKLSIFEAISMAGDINEYGNRKKVILIRNEENNNIRHEISLVDNNILSSNYYYLRPGDIIYVKPLQSKSWGLRPFPFALILSAVSTTYLVLNYYTN